MKYPSIIFATALAFSGLASAADDNTMSESEMSDIKVECIQAALGEELSGDQKDAYIKECMAKKIPTKAQSKNKD